MGQISAMWFDTECDAKVYLDNWYLNNRGYGKIEYSQWKQKEKPLQQFPLKIGLPIIVNSRHHLSKLTRK